MGLEADFRHDLQADAVYIQLRSGVAHAFTRELDEGRLIDFGTDHQPTGIELLDVSAGVDTHGLPERGTVERLLTEHRIRLLV